MRKKTLKLRNNFYWFLNKLLTGHQTIINKDTKGPFLLDQTGLLEKPQEFDKIMVNWEWWKNFVWFVNGVILLFFW